MALLASQEVPAAMADLQHQGSLLTLFLFNPTVAFLYVCNLDEVSTSTEYRLINIYTNNCKLTYIQLQSCILHLHSHHSHHVSSSYVRLFRQSYVSKHCCLLPTLIIWSHEYTKSVYDCLFILHL